jgi:hypothetical protein
MSARNLELHESRKGPPHAETRVLPAQAGHGREKARRGLSRAGKSKEAAGRNWLPSPPQGERREAQFEPGGSIQAAQST